jgi:LAO/AO transport system kinase
MASSLSVLLPAVLRGEPRAIARAITAIENRNPAEPGEADELLRQVFPHSGRALLAGLTGAPGAGKSTLADSLAGLLRQRAKTVGIVAVDPSSPFTGGAILGDRIRMQRHHGDSGVFIRSMATRGALGGLAPAAADVATLLDAAGKQVVLIETVGVGQDEVDIVRLADVTVVILAPGMGDDVQTMKAGIMEIADVFAINKADRPGADRVEQELRAMLALTHREDGWSPPIVKTVASEGRGVEELWIAVEAFVSHLRDQDLLARKRALHLRRRLVDLLGERLLARVLAGLPEARLDEYVGAIAARRMDPYSAVEDMISGWEKR